MVGGIPVYDKPWWHGNMHGQCTNMYIDVLLMVIDLLIQICCFCDVMFYTVCVISPIILMLCCPL